MTGHTRDLSPAGIQFELGLPLEREQIIKIEGRFVDAIGRVATCRRLEGRRRPRFAIGAAFITRRFDRPRGTFVSMSV